MKNLNKKDSQYYLNLPYAVETRAISPEDGGGFTACIPDLGRWTAIGDGSTYQEAYENLMASLPGLIEDWINDNVLIPEPTPEMDLPSGNLSVRLPRTLHAKVISRAQYEGVSINAYITNILSQATVLSLTLDTVESALLRHMSQWVPNSAEQQDDVYHFSTQKKNPKRQELNDWLNNKLTRPLLDASR
jgi:antitoxin HicB